MEINPLGHDGPQLLRCYDCRKGLDISNMVGGECPYCFGRRWTTMVGRLTLWEKIRLYRMSGIWFCNEGDWLSRWRDGGKERQHR